RDKSPRPVQCATRGRRRRRCTARPSCSAGTGTRARRGATNRRRSAPWSRRSRWLPARRAGESGLPAPGSRRHPSGGGGGTGWVNLTVATWNLHGSARPDLDQIAQRLDALRADVVALQEVRCRQARTLARTLGWETAHWSFKHWPFWNPPEGLAVLSPHPLV